jgi:squalene-hopene/tetraprenyl-beta-curcumene cyclase
MSVCADVTSSICPAATSCCRRRRGLFTAVAFLTVAGGQGATLYAAVPRTDGPAVQKRGADQAQLRRTVQAAIGYLRAQGQTRDGSFSSFAGPGVTAIVTTALLRNGLTVDDPMVAQALAYIQRLVHADGGVYQPGSLYRNYETCLALMCFAAANRDGHYDQIVKKADRFLKGLQWDEAEGHDLASTSYGGAGYGKHKRPDLSNTSFLVEALIAGGNGPDDEAVQKALIFVSRCQNLETPHNTTEFSTKNPDGGFYYTVAAGGSSQAGETLNGGLRSYGSMTYAGLKSMIYAGVEPDDPRVQGALKWIRRHYGLDSNPGLGDAGLYYYYHTFAKALSGAGHDLIEGTDGQKHDWRSDLVTALAQRQQPDGSWVNRNARWLEGDPNLVTGYALLALSHCRDPGAQR